MKPRVKLATTRTPDGSEVHLFLHDGTYSIKVNGLELMNSRQHESELELARLGCASAVKQPAPRILIGGLGLGYTLRQTLDLVGHHAKVVVVELLDDVVAWNRTILGELNGHPLNDARVTIKTGDVVDLITRSKGAYDVILLDIDNGPRAFTDPGNQRLYGKNGLQACRLALREHGCLAFWSSESDKAFEHRLMSCGFQVRRYRAAAYKGGKPTSRFIWVASEDASILPPGGGEPIVKAAKPKVQRDVPSRFSKPKRL